MNSTKRQSERLFLHPGEWLSWLLVSLLVAATASLPFFWDTLQLASRHAHFFYDHSFSSLFLPTDMDSGHIPAFGMFLALVWKAVGRSLAASHLAMLPFILGALFFTRRIAGILFPRRHRWLATLVIIADATLLAQFTLVSPDIWIACFFTMALFAFLKGKRGLMTLAFIGLALTSVRGMMIVASFFVTGALLLIFTRKEEPRVSLRKKGIRYLLESLPVYLPAALLAMGYLGLHLIRTGWIGYHPDMPWADHFARVGFRGFLRNILIFGWRMADHGRLFLWIAGVATALYAFRKKLPTTATGRTMMLLTLVLTVVFSYSALTYRNLAGHRYLLPLFLMVSMTVIYHLFLYVRREKTVILLLFLLLAGELSGNFWVYPDSIAKGWDASLAYLPYQTVRCQMNCFFNGEGIAPEEVGTSFPNNIAFRFIDLTDDTRSYGTAGEREFRYLLWSNVFNDFPEELKEEMDRDGKVVREIRRLQVRMVLYENPGFGSSGENRKSAP